MSADTGGPAFPCMRDMRHIPAFDHEEGMTLRDFFAAKADVSRLEINSADVAEKLVGRPLPLDQVEAVIWQLELVAVIRYIAADAMLKERAK